MAFIPITDALVETIEDSNAAFQSEKRKIWGVATGLDDLDRILGGLRPSELTVIAGRPGMGKSALAAHIAVGAAMKQQANEENGAVVGVFSLETIAKRWAQRVLAASSKLATNNLDAGMIDESDFVRLVEASRSLGDLPLFIDDTPGITISVLVDRATALQKQRGLGLLVVDYLQLVAGDERQGEGQFQEISEITAVLKKLAMKLKIPVIAVSQLSRTVENREYKQPILTDLVGSGSIEQDADVVIFIYRDEFYLNRAKPAEGTMEFQDWMAKMQSAAGYALLLVAKQRHGPIGSVRVRFDESSIAFQNVPRSKQ